MSDNNQGWRDAMLSKSPDDLVFRLGVSLDRIEDLEDEVARLRKFFERMSHDEWGFSDIDGGDFQDYAVEQGLLVQVPADEAFKAEWGSDHMYVFSWSPLATENPPAPGLGRG